MVRHYERRFRRPSFFDDGRIQEYRFEGCWNNSVCRPRRVSSAARRAQICPQGALSYLNEGVSVGGDANQASVRIASLRKGTSGEFIGFVRR
jgi:hypothetical protein